MNKSFIETKGFIHLVHSLHVRHTLCGNVLPINPDDPVSGWKRTSKQYVTCPDCQKVITSCQGISFSRKAKYMADRERNIPDNCPTCGGENHYYSRDTDNYYCPDCRNLWKGKYFNF